MGGLPVFVALGGFLFLWGIVNYSTLARIRQHVEEYLNQVLNLAQQKYNLAQELIKLLPQASEETGSAKATLEKWQKFANEGLSPELKLEADTEITKISQTLLDQVEENDSSKTHADFLRIKEEIAQIQEQVLVYRRKYKFHAEDYNDRINTMPAKVIAGLFRFKAI